MLEQSFQVGIKAVARNQEGAILAIHDTKSDRWDIPGGRIDAGEDIVDCLNRELREEIGVSATNLTLGTVTTSLITLPKAPDHRLLLVVYKVELAGEPFANEANTELVWLRAQDLATKITNKYSPDFCGWINDL